jgi:hypothetical protein
LKESKLQKGIGGKETKTKTKIIAVIKHFKGNQLQEEGQGKQDKKTTLNI